MMPGVEAVIRVQLPTHLRTLARIEGEVLIHAGRKPTGRILFDALEERYPNLRGTIRDPATGERRPFLRFFACGSDLSHVPPDDPLPQPVAEGVEPFLIVGAVAGG